jgi:hypothetical protein
MELSRQSLVRRTHSLIASAELIAMETIASVRRVSHSPLAADGGTRRSRRVGFSSDLGLGDLGLDEHAARKMSANVSGLLPWDCCLHNEANWQRRD